jgi:cell division protein FtsB
MPQAPAWVQAQSAAQEIDMAKTSEEMEREIAQLKADVEQLKRAVGALRRKEQNRGVVEDG